MEWSARTIERIKEWIIRRAEGPYAVPFLFLYSYVETLLLPTPTEMALIPLVLIKARSWVIYALAATLGSLAGALTGYFIGVVLYETVGSAIVAWYSFEEEIVYIRELLAQHTFWAVFIAAFTPLPDKVFMPLAGLLKAPLAFFVAAVVLGRGIRFFLVAYLTNRYGMPATQLFLKYLTEVTVAVSVFLLVVLFYWFLR